MNMRWLLVFLLAGPALASDAIWAPTAGRSPYDEQIVGQFTWDTVVWCVDWVTSDVGIASGTKLAFGVGNTTPTPTTCDVGIYSADGSTKLVSAGGIACGTSPRVKTVTGLTAFTLAADTEYRLCWCASSRAGRYVGIDIDTYLDTMAALGFATNLGKAANACSAGVLPATTGALTGTLDGTEPVPNEYELPILLYLSKE